LKEIQSKLEPPWWNAQWRHAPAGGYVSVCTRDKNQQLFHPNKK